MKTSPRSDRVKAPGDELPSITEVSAPQGIGTGVIRHALEALAADGLIIVRHGPPRSSPESPAVIRA